ncbi:MAG: hypothetical protein P8P30_08725 [Rickettsiales bacterium]|nr:hypothetical protein [Rickettsiales bacterium]
MGFKKEIKEQFSSQSSMELICTLREVGDRLYASRRTDDKIENAVKDFNQSASDYQLTLKRSNNSPKKIQPFHLRVATGVNEEGETSLQTAFSRETVGIKVKDGNPYKIKFDASANYKDGDPNWAICGSIRNNDGSLKKAVVYMPVLGEFYFADKKAAYRIRLPRFEGEKTEIKQIKIPPLRTKFGAEYTSMHTQERAIFKALFSTLVRENVGGSLHEIGMDEVPSIWTGLGIRSHAVTGNLTKSSGELGAFIAEKAGATVIRAPIITDSKGRDILFVMHPKIANKVIEKFVAAVKLAKGDFVTENTHFLVEPSALHEEKGRN